MRSPSISAMGGNILKTNKVHRIRLRFAGRLFFGQAVSRNFFCSLAPLSAIFDDKNRMKAAPHSS